MPALGFNHVRFGYDTAPSPIFDSLSLTFPPGWTGIVGANGLGKTTLLRLAVGELLPDSGVVSRSGPARICPQRLDDPPLDLGDLLVRRDADASLWRGLLGLGPDWAGRWATLSPGERRRAWLASILASSPAILAVDEPTNHLDAAGRDVVARALASFGGVGLLVSHDRALLTALCARTLTLEPGRAVLRPLAVEEALAEADRERSSRRRARDRAEEELARARASLASRVHAAAQADARNSGRHLDRHDHDGRARLNLARVTGRDGRAGQLKAQLEGRLAQAAAALAETEAEPETTLGIDLQGEVARRDRLVVLPAGRIPLGAGRALVHPELVVGPSDRIALVGPNGAGKTTLLGHLEARLSIPPARVVWMAQDLPESAGPALIAELRRLPSARRGQVLALVARLGSRAEALLETDSPSPGEARKLLLALGLERRPWLVVLDEPTNHLDLPAIQCLEKALSEVRCALLLVSHDRVFLSGLVTRTWRLDPGGGLADVPGFAG